jgi:hypothetical protein
MQNGSLLELAFDTERVPILKCNLAIAMVRLFDSVKISGTSGRSMTTREEAYG